MISYLIGFKPYLEPYRLLTFWEFVGAQVLCPAYVPLMSRHSSLI